MVDYCQRLAMALLKIKSGLLIVTKKVITAIVVPRRPKAVSRLPQTLLPTTASGCGVDSSAKSTGVSGLGAAFVNSAGVSRSAAEFDTLKADEVGASNNC